MSRSKILTGLSRLAKDSTRVIGALQNEKNGRSYSTEPNSNTLATNVNTVENNTPIQNPPTRNKSNIAMGNPPIENKIENSTTLQRNVPDYAKLEIPLTMTSELAFPTIDFKSTVATLLKKYSNLSFEDQSLDKQEKSEKTSHLKSKAEAVRQRVENYIHLIQEVVDKTTSVEPHTKDFVAPKDIIDEIVNGMRQNSGSRFGVLVINFTEPYIRATAAIPANFLFSMFADKTGKVPKEKAGKLMRFMAYITIGIIVTTIYKIYTDEVKKIAQQDKEVAAGFAKRDETLKAYFELVDKTEQLVAKGVALAHEEQSCEKLIQVLDESYQGLVPDSYLSMLQTTAQVYLHSIVNNKTLDAAQRDVTIHNQLQRQSNDSKDENSELAKELLLLETISGYQGMRANLVQKQEKLKQKHEHINQKLEKNVEKMQDLKGKLELERTTLEEKGEEIKNQYFVKLGIIDSELQSLAKMETSKVTEQDIMSKFKALSRQIRGDDETSNDLLGNIM